MKNVAFNSGGLHRTTVNKKRTTCYSVWASMINRCYNSKRKDYHRYGGRGVTVCKDWLDFQVFAEWFERNYIEGYKLDKDLTNQGSMQYNEQNCCFIPHEINSALTAHNSKRGNYPVGVYFEKNSGKYKAQCAIGIGRQVNLGRFANEDEAFQMYKKFKENFICELAKKHFEMGNINCHVFSNLIKWRVVKFP